LGGHEEKTLKMRHSALKFFAAAALALTMAGAASLAQEGNQERNWERERDWKQQQRNNRNAWPSERLNPQAQQRNVPGEFDYYALVLSWSPSYCSDARSGDDETQCNRRDGRRFNFILHGLWPQYNRGYPESCHTSRRPFVPQPLIDSMLDIMPSSRLVIHEYRKHGTCSGLSPEGYYQTARRMFERIRIPDKYKNPMEALFMSPDQVEADIIRANPELSPDMLAVACGGAGNRLKEIRICFSKDGAPQRCGSNEDQRRLCSSNRMFVPPVRSTARDENYSGSDRKAPPSSRPNPLPAPRMIDGDRNI
jgi:ribonuclease T2